MGVVVLVSLGNWFTQSAFASGLVHSTANLSQGRYWLAATTVGNKALFAGGSGASNVVDIYDADTNTWSTATLSQARSQLSATTVGNKAMFAGGYYYSGGHRYSDVVDIYDIDADTWTTATLSLGRDSLAATTVGNKAMFAGGSNSNVVDIYNADTDTWSTATLSVARSLLVATTVGNKALFAGGGAYSNVVDIYDADTDTWSTATLSQGRTCMSATALGSKAFFAGGSIVGGRSDVVDIYDANTDTWSTATLSQPRHDLSATTVGKKALFAGGEDSKLSSLVDIYDADTDTWYTETLLQARAYLCATTVGTKAFLAGGLADDGIYSNVVDIYTISELTLSLIKPNGGEAMLQGSTCDICWSGNLPDGDVLLEYSVNNGKDWESIVTTEDTGSYEWEIDGPQSNQYLVRVSDVTDWYAFDTSDSDFTVYTCQEEIHGDENGDCIVDMVDFAITAQNWLKKGFVRIFFSPLDSSPEWIMEGQWEFGAPTGNGGSENGNPDPSSGCTGSNVYGVNINGDYTTAIGGPYCLTAGPFDCNKFHDMKLRFARWLNTDEPDYVASRIEVSNDGANWHNLWENTADITDSNWQVVEYDAGETADNEATVYFRWSYEILDDRAYPYSGWNIDDIELLGKF